MIVNDLRETARLCDFIPLLSTQMGMKLSFLPYFDPEKGESASKSGKNGTRK